MNHNQKQNRMAAMLAAAAFGFASGSAADDRLVLMTVQQASLWVDGEVDPILSAVNFERVRKFILDQRLVMMTSRYVNVPCFRTAHYDFSLHPGPQVDIQGDLRGWPAHAFTTLAIREHGSPKGTSATWRHDRDVWVDFEQSHAIYIHTSANNPAITVGDLHAFPTAALVELLETQEIVSGGDTAPPPASQGNCLRER